MSWKPPTLATLLAPLLYVAIAVVPAAAQFDDVDVPPEMEVLDFMLGSWSVEGRFRTPDHVHPDRTLWYRTADGGVTRFDGRTWVSFRLGDDDVADSVLSVAPDRGEPFSFSHPRDATRIQDGFVLLIDDGRASGSTLVFFDATRRAWESTALHAPSAVVNRASAPDGGGTPVFEGRATDRRGERVFRRRYEVLSPDHYRILTDVSFDGGETWIADQIVQDVRRRAPAPDPEGRHGPVTRVGPN